jgi:hypothetical protein
MILLTRKIFFQWSEPLNYVMLDPRLYALIKLLVKFQKKISSKKSKFFVEQLNLALLIFDSLVDKQLNLTDTLNLKKIKIIP